MGFCFPDQGIEIQLLMTAEVVLGADSYKQRFTMKLESSKCLPMPGTSGNQESPETSRRGRNLDPDTMTLFLNPRLTPELHVCGADLHQAVGG